MKKVQQPRSSSGAIPSLLLVISWKVLESAEYKKGSKGENNSLEEEKAVGALRELNNEVFERD